MRTVLLMSGGLDSAVLLAWLLERGNVVCPVRINYGQRHARELVASERIIKWARETWPDQVRTAVDVDLRSVGRLLPSSQTAEIDVPEGHYTDVSMKQTVVPNRNMLLLSVATGLAVAKGCTGVAYGAHAGDHAIYPDCRPVFVEAMRAAIRICDYSPVELEAPFLHWDKTQIVSVGSALGVPFELTWTCYSGRHKACGKCGSCVERLEAFAKNELVDPLEYE